MLYEYEGAVRFVGMDEAIIGVAEVWNEEGEKRIRLVYSYEAILAHLMVDDAMDYEGAVEYLEFNIAGAYLGPDTPIIVEEI